MCKSVLRAAGRAAKEVAGEVTRDADHGAER